ncbi:MAG: rRNA ((1402)-N(4))-methyltransferase RsmH [Pseudomonadota bacterium]|jgi:16S rRNA (cytosine1402-N4)-methyltransferase
MTSFDHVTVLLDETVDLITQPLENNAFPNNALVFVDCTLGGAGHTLHLLEKLANKLRTGALNASAIEHICCDQDPHALDVASQRIQHWQSQNLDLPVVIQVTPLAINFRELNDWMGRHRPSTKVAGMMADLGVSSPQIDNPERGFSFLREGPLDMRMNTEAKTTARDLLLTVEADELENIFTKYGEEPRSRALARAIVKDREKGILPMSNTVEFANYISRVLGYHQSRVHPATRIFQALRIAVNEELSAVEELLSDLPRLMASGSCAGLISFHSLEDRIVKRYFRAWEQGEPSPEAKRAREKKRWTETQMGLFGVSEEDNHSFGQEMPRGGIVSGEKELKVNPRARSARLRGFRFSGLA